MIRNHQKKEETVNIKFIEEKTTTEIDEDEQEHPAIAHWLDDEDDKGFQRMRPPPRRMGRSGQDD